MVSRRLCALIAVLVVSVALAGCLGAEDDDQHSAEELRAGAVDAMENVDSYTMRTTANVSVSGTETTTQSQEVVMRVDQADRRASIEQTVQSSGTTQTVEAYLVDDTMYVQQAGTWQTRQLPQDPWAGAGAGQTNQFEILGSANVTHNGSETIDGVETEVLELNMTGDDYEQLLQEQANQSGTGSLGSLVRLADVQSVTIRQYVATEEPHYVHRVESEVAITVVGQEAETSSVLTFEDFEEDVTVELPEDLPDD